MSGYMTTKFCEACDEDYDWAAPECPGCVRRRYDEARDKRFKELVVERDEFRARWEVEVKEAEEAMRERDALRVEVERLRGALRSVVKGLDHIPTCAYAVDGYYRGIALAALKEEP